jgi:two-component system, NarL family, nitrate/nitrite sensor histidine kinase NarX
MHKALFVRRRRRRSQADLKAAQSQLGVLQQRLEMVRKLNSLLVDAGDEKVLVETALDLVWQLVGARGVTFVPFDEYGQPLPAFSQGSLPEPTLKSWSEHLNSPDVRGKCKACNELQAGSDSTCPLASLPSLEKIYVVCLPVQREARMLGMLNLYLPPTVKMDGDTQTFLKGILNEIAVAVESIRLRNQELTTLRQLQMLRSSKMDLVSSLGELLDQVHNVLEASFAWMEVQTADHDPNFIKVTRGPVSQPFPKFLEEVDKGVFETGQSMVVDPVNDFSTFPAGAGLVLVTPLCLSDRPAVGVLGIGFDHTYAFHPDQLPVLQMVAIQAAQLVEHERMMLDLEYQAVVKERTRLAREIHDGLAQTMAFLKLQTGQMQNYLARNDLTRLNLALQSNYQALSEAYLDIRQAIDNLRLTPHEGLQSWLGQLAADFKQVSGLEVNLNVSTASALRYLTTEVQAQLIRIAQEALSNVRKHAHARAVWISLREWSGNLILEVRDDGQGFSPEDIPGMSQYGLKGMRERAELIGADFQIISQPRQGTTVSIHLPVPFEETVA